MPVCCLHNNTHNSHLHPRTHVHAHTYTHSQYTQLIPTPMCTLTHIHTHNVHTAIIDELLKHGAQVKEKNRLGWTPLDEAISYGNKSTSKHRT